MPADLARTIMQTITTILIALPLLLACGALIVGYVLWRKRRRADDAQSDDPDKRAQRPIWRPGGE